MHFMAIHQLTGAATLPQATSLQGTTPQETTPQETNPPATTVLSATTVPWRHTVLIVQI